MKQNKVIYQQYCPVLSKNVTIEKHYPNENEQHFQCLNNHQCECPDGACMNKLIATAIPFRSDIPGNITN